MSISAVGSSPRWGERCAVNITSVLHRHLRGTPCAVYMSDVKVRVSAVDAFYYPDMVVSCEPYRPESL